MATQTLLDQVSTLLDQSGVAQGALAHAPSGVHMLRFSATTGQDASVYRPLLCLVLQGAKEVGCQCLGPSVVGCWKSETRGSRAMCSIGERAGWE